MRWEELLYIHFSAEKVKVRPMVSTVWIEALTGRPLSVFLSTSWHRLETRPGTTSVIWFMAYCRVHRLHSCGVSGGPAYPLQLPMPIPSPSLLSGRLGMNLSRAISPFFTYSLACYPAPSPLLRWKVRKYVFWHPFLCLVSQGGELEKALPVGWGGGERGGA
jgi:hypothetical protein